MYQCMDKMFLSFYYDLVVDRVFRGDCSTKQVYEEGVKAIALSVVGGINCKHITFSDDSLLFRILTWTQIPIYNSFSKYFCVWANK